MYHISAAVARGAGARDRTEDFRSLVQASQQQQQRQAGAGAAAGGSSLLPPSALAFGPAPPSSGAGGAYGVPSAATAALTPGSARGGAGASAEIERARRFNRAARAIASGMVMATERIERLTSLVRSRAPFSDSSAEISRLTVDIKQDLLNTNRAITSLAASLSESAAAAAAASRGGRPAPHEQADKVAKLIVTDLQTRLADQSRAFNELLLQRSQYLREQSDRRGAFEHQSAAGVPGGGGDELRSRGLAQFGRLRQRLAGAVAGADAGGTREGGGDDDDDDDDEAGIGGYGSGTRADAKARLLGASGGGASSNSSFAGAGVRGGAAGRGGVSLPKFTALLSAGGGDETATETDGEAGRAQQQAQTLVERGGAQRNEYLASRAAALKTIQSTTEEIAGMYKRLNLLVHMQEEMTMRIDANVEETVVNVDEGHQELVKYLEGLSSNQWLVIKVFAVVIAFAILFVTVIA